MKADKQLLPFGSPPLIGLTSFGGVAISMFSTLVRMIANPS